MCANLPTSARPVTVDRRISSAHGEQIYDWPVPARIRRWTGRPANVCGAAAIRRHPGISASPYPGNAAAAGAISETAAVVARCRGGIWPSRWSPRVVTAIVFASRSDDASDHTALTDASAKAAIQEYLDALSKGTIKTVARHTLCGLFDAVKEHRSDLALAG